MISQFLARFLPICFSLLFAVGVAAQPEPKSQGIKLFDSGDFAGAVEALKKSDDFVDLNYLGYAYEKLGNEKEARNAFDRSFKNGYKEYGEEIINRASFDKDRPAPVEKLSIFLEKNVQQIIVAAVSARRTLELKGPSAKDNLWSMRARMIGQIESILASNRMVYSSRELDVDAMITSKPRPGYTDAARTNGTQGTVDLLLLLDVDGTVKGILPTKLLATGLTEQSYNAATKIVFAPAKRAANPVAVLKTVSYSFSIY